MGSLTQAIRGSVALLPARDRRIFWGLLAMTAVAAFLEAVGVGALLPVVALITDPTPPERGFLARQLYAVAAALDGRISAVTAAFLLVALFVLKNGFLSLLTQLRFSFVYRRQVETARRLFEAYLRRSYAEHLRHNSAELLRNLHDEVRAAHHHALHAVLMLVAEVSVLGVVAVFLVALDPVVAGIALVVVGVAGLSFFVAVRRRAARLGEGQVAAKGDMNRWVDQGLAAFKELKLSGRENAFVEAHAGAGVRFADAARFVAVAKQVPYYFLETLGATGLAVVVAVGSWRGYDLEALAPLLAVFVVAAMRLTPSFNRILRAATTIRHYAASVEVVRRELQEAERPPRPEAPPANPIRFDERIELQDLTITYPDAATPAIGGVCLRIEKGKVVAFVGASGAGKTTLADAILGLLEPSAGAVAVDGIDIRTNLTSWQRQLGYVPQDVYLLDDSIRRNVALGMDAEEIDDARVWGALRAAQLEALVRALPEGLDTVAGERGLRFSGGERQRIGIARALYHEPKVLVMDEPTSALDHQTEKQIVETVFALRPRCTVIIIAHRLSTVEECDRIFLVSSGRVAADGPYRELLDESEEFRALVASS